MLKSGLNSMKAWRISRYGFENDCLQLKNDVRVPPIVSPDQILIKVKAASLNPIDSRMKEGYGKTILGAYRQANQCSIWAPQNELPLTLGRDCSGVVMETGRNVSKFKSGDQVWCTVGAERQGCFSEYMLANERFVSVKPRNLSHIEAASIPYVACTVWPALCTVARLDDYFKRKFSILIHAGSGGIGSFAVQFAKVYNARVTVTCNPHAIDFLRSLGANNVVDYNGLDSYEQLSSFGPYDIILDSVDTQLSRDSVQLLGLWRGSVHVNICNPLLRNTDHFGLWPGLLQSGVEFSTNFFRHALNGRVSVWAYVYPSGRTLDAVRTFVEEGLIKPVVQETFKFDDLDKAFERLQQGNIHGKIVLQMED